MKKCDKCGLEMSVYKVVKEVVGGVEKTEKVYICRKKNCENHKKETLK